MHERIGILALLAGCIFATVPASAADKGGPPVTKKNWHNHPAIVDIRKLFQENEAELKAGRLRFALGRTGALNDTSVEHRLYYSEDGKLLWHDRKQQGSGYPFLMDWPQKYVVRDAAKELGVQPDCRD